MKALTENQKNFILDYFFKNERYAGWRGIAMNLLSFGWCIVAGENCIWQGGIGNFIKTKKTEKAAGCLLYEFDLEEFLSSEWYREVQSDYVSILGEKKMKVEEECERKLRGIAEEYKEICLLRLEHLKNSEI